MKKSLVAVLAAIVIVVIAVVAVAVYSPGVKEVTAEEIKEGMIEATGDIETYQFDMDMKMDMTITNETGEVEKMTMTLAGDGAADIVNRKVKTTMTGNLEVLEGEEMPGPMETQTYVINDTIYTITSIPGIPANWTKMAMPEEYWEMQNQVELQREMMNVSEVEILGDEKVDGTDCYVLKITPDMEKYWETMMKQPGMEMTNVSDIESIKEMSIKSWIAKSTYFPMKTEMQMKMVMTEEDVPEAEEPFEMTIDMGIDMLLHHYNETVSIELPEEAESAEEIPAM
jgi:hypothetical protein